MRTRYVMVGVLFLAGLFSLNAVQFSSGPPLGRTGAPGEGTCAGCHGGSSGGTGEVQITPLNGVTEYLPGDTLLLEVSVADPGNNALFGFEITALDDQNNGLGSFIDPSGNEVNTGTQGGRPYAHHGSAGTTPNQTNARTWLVEWIAPQNPTGPVTFYAAGNAANGNGASSGDLIYTTNLELPLATPTSRPAPGSAPPQFTLLGNPVRAALHLAYRLPGTAPARLEVLSLHGRVLLHKRLNNRGGHLQLPLTDFANGTYLLRIVQQGRQHTERFLLAR